MEIQTKIVKNGSSFALAIPKAFIDCKTLEFGKTYKVRLEEIKEQENNTENPHQYTNWYHLNTFPTIAII